MYGISTKADRGTLDEVVSQLDKILFDDFVKRKAEDLLEISERGLLKDGTEWAGGGKPTG
jgi:exocyst complex component 2